MPEEGVSRLVTQQISERRDHYIRYGLAFMLEHGFMKTERGRLCYNMNLEQIRNAILETAYLGVLDAYLRCKVPSYMGGIRAGAQRLSSRGLAKALSQEVQQFAMIQKSEYGFDLLDALGKKALKLIGVTPDLWILPENMKMYVNLVRKENFQALLAGDKAAPGPTGSRASGSTRDIILDIANDCRVVETKSFELPNMAEPLDPMQRPATIGEYYTMHNHLRGACPPASYRSSWRDIFIYNEDKDGFTRISLDAALRACGRFDGEAGTLLEPRIEKGAHQSSDVPPDMFLHNDGSSTGLKDVRFMGDMHSQYLRDGGLTDWADSVMAKIGRTPDVMRKIRDGLDLCRRIDACTQLDGVQNTWALWLWMAHVAPRTASTWSEEHGLPLPPTVDEIKGWVEGHKKASEMWTLLSSEESSPADIKKKLAEIRNAPATRADGNEGTQLEKLLKEYNTHLESMSKMPYWAVIAAGGNKGGAIHSLVDSACSEIRAMPVGYANYPGLCILAQPRYAQTFGETHRVARDFVNAFETIYSELTAHVNDSIFMRPESTPPWLKAKDGRSSLFSHVFYVSASPIWMRMQSLSENEDIELPPVIDENVSKNWFLDTNDRGFLNRDTATFSLRKQKGNYNVLPDKYIEIVVRLAAVLPAARRFEDYDEAFTKSGSYGHAIMTFCDKLSAFLMNVPGGPPSESLKSTTDRVTQRLKAYLTKPIMMAAQIQLDAGRRAGPTDANYQACIGTFICWVLEIIVENIVLLPAPEGEDARVRAAFFIHRATMITNGIEPSILSMLTFMLHGTALLAYARSTPAAKFVYGNGRPTAPDANIKSVLESASKTGHIVVGNAADMGEVYERVYGDITLPTGNNYCDIAEDNEVLNPSTSGDKTKQTVSIPIEAILSSDGTQKEYLLMTRLTGSHALAAAVSNWSSHVHDANVPTHAWSQFIVGLDPNEPLKSEGSMGTINILPPLFQIHPGQFDKAKAASHKRNRNTGSVFGAPRFGASASREEGGRGGKAQRTNGGPLRFNLSEFDADADDGEDTLGRDPWNNGDGVPRAGPTLGASFRRRWMEVSRAEVDPIRRCLKLVFLGQPVEETTFMKIIACDDVFPFGFLLFRPYMTYSMASAILTVSGARTGETLVGHADFQLADNVVQKMHIGHCTMYLKSIGYQPHHVWIAETVLACGSIAGNNCEYRSAGGKSEPPQAPQDASIYSLLMPYDCPSDGAAPWERELPNPLDITGEYATGNPMLSSLKNSVTHKHYPCAKHYRALYEWNNDDQGTLDPESMGTANRYNTLCFQGHQAQYNPVSQRYDLVIENTGHRGNRIYAGDILFPLLF